jgi:antitoxin PrlF
MAIAKSRLTAQGQISVPAEVRRRLGLAPGSVIEWDEEGGRIIVRRAGGASFAEIRKVLFPEGPPSPPVTVEQMDEGIRQYMRKKYGPLARKKNGKKRARR